MPIYYNPKLEAQKARDAKEKTNVMMIETQDARSTERPDIERYYRGQVYRVPVFLARAFLEAGVATITKQHAYETPYKRKPIYTASEGWNLF